MTSMANRFAKRCVLLILTLSFGHVMAQGPTATILGTVMDTSGAAIPDANLQIKNSDTGVSQNTSSDSQGRYRIPDLPIGNYEVIASKEGFQTTVRGGIVLSVGQTGVVDFALPVGQSRQVVTVQSEVSQVETATAAVSSLVDQTQIRELPLNGRNIQQLVYLAPGVQQYNGFGFGAFRGGAAGGYSVSGSRPVGQVQLLDNQNMQNWWTTGSGAITLGTSLGVDAIAEFQVLTGVYGAQFGGNGALLNSVTKSGTNTFHGSAFEFLRNSAMDARNFFDKGDVPAFRKNQFGGTLGGPIKKNKAFFYFNYEGLRQTLVETKVANVPDANAHKGYLPCQTGSAGCDPATNLVFVGVDPAVQKTLAALPLPTNVIGEGVGTIVENAPQIAAENYFLGRFDYTFSEKDSVYARYISDKATLQEPFTVSSLPLWPESDYSWNHFATIEERHIFSSNIFNLLRFSYSRPAQHGRSVGGVDGFNFTPGSPDRQNGTVSITGVTTGVTGVYGPLSQTPYDLIVNRFNEAEDLSWIKGAHTLKFGLSFTRRDNNTYNLFRQGGAWTFPSLQAFLTNKPSLLQGLLPGNQYGHRDLREIQVEPYFQDDWKVTQTLTMNIGLRYGFVSNPIDVHDALNEIVDPQSGNAYTHVDHLFQNGNPSKWNLDPRFGLAWDPFKDHKTSFRAGFGIYHDLIVYQYFPALWSQPPASSAQVSNPTSFPVAFAGNVPPLLQTSPGYDFRVNKSPYMIQWNFNIQRQIMSNTTLTVGYQGSRGVHLMNSVEQNPVIPRCCTTDGRQIFSAFANGRLVPFARIDPAYAALLDAVNIGLSRYNGLQVGLSRRFTPNLTYQVSYTYSHSIDDGSAATAGESGNNGSNQQDPYNYRAERSNSAFDIRHQLRVNGLYVLPFRGNRAVEGWQLSGIVAYQTGVPITVQNGFDQMGDGTTTRPDYNMNCTNLILGTVAHWFNPACFSPPPLGAPGNLARTSVPGPHMANVDAALMKDTKIRESMSLQFRAEVFNIFNHANFGFPSPGVFTLNTTTGGSTVASSAGQITNTLNPSRQIQLGLKLTF